MGQASERIERFGGKARILALLPYSKLSHVRFVGNTPRRNVISNHPQAAAKVKFEFAITALVFAPGERSSRTLPFVSWPEYELQRDKHDIKNSRACKQGIRRVHVFNWRAPKGGSTTRLGLTLSLRAYFDGYWNKRQHQNRQHSPYKAQAHRVERLCVSFDGMLPLEANHGESGKDGHR